MKAELMSLFATLEFRMIDSKYISTFSLSFTVLDAPIALYTSCKCYSSYVLSILAATWSEVQASKGRICALKTNSPAFSISLFPIIGFTAVSEL